MPLTQHVLKYNKEKSVIGQILKTTPLNLPSVLRQGPNLAYDTHEALGAVADHDDIHRAFPNTYGRARISLKPSGEVKNSAPFRIGVVLSGGQAPGGHNVIAGIYDYVKKISAQSVVIGFLDGPHGIYSGNYCIVDDEMMDTYRNTGGFDMIGSGRHKIEKPAEFAASMENCIALDLDGLVIIGGDDSNTNGAVLAEYFEANKCKTKVCGAPKTIDGDLKVDPYIPISFGFDTACRTYSEQIGNLCQDVLSTQNYYHFVRLMGRAASNIALECALQTRPNICLISEEVEEQKMTLAQITQQVVDVIVKRSQAGKDYGIVLLPEGLIEFIPEFNALISEINDILAHGCEPTEAAVMPLFSEHNRAVFSYLPEAIKMQLLLDRDPHGNVQVAKIETERLLAQTVQTELENLARLGLYKGTFQPQYHSYGYEGRSCFPSSFDATYCYVLGQNVAAMLSLGCNGLISSVTNLTAPVSEWNCGGVPITMLCHMEKRHGHMKPVIKKALVELDGEPFKWFSAQRADWAVYDLYRSPGPLQFFGDANSVELCITLTLELMKQDARMLPANLEAAKSIQNQALKFSPFTNAPLIGAGATILSTEQVSRSIYRPSLLPVFTNGTTTTTTQGGEGSVVQIVSGSGADKSSLKIGVVFAGAVAPGMHDIVSGLFDSLAGSSGSSLVGFVGGVTGLINNVIVPITAEKVATYRGQGGCELLGQSVEIIDTTAYDAIAQVCTSNGLAGLVLVGGAVTMANTTALSTHFTSKNIATKVVAVPADITGSVAFDTADSVKMSVGFDTFTKVAGQIVGNNATDGGSAKKYYYFMRIMGKDASHTTLEVALKTQSNCVLISEEIKGYGKNLNAVVGMIADVIVARATDNKNYGTVLIPEGILHAIPEVAELMIEMDAIYAKNSNVAMTVASISPLLPSESASLLASMPDYVQSVLLTPRGIEKVIDVSQIDTEKYFTFLVGNELADRKKQGSYKGSFSVVPSYIGYQARGAAPSNFDINLAYNLGFTATSLIASNLTGYTATISGLSVDFSTWTASGVSSSLLGKKSMVNVGLPVFRNFAATRDSCKVVDRYINPGPLQFVGPAAIVDSLPLCIS
eukprot:gene9985-20762_t